MISLMPRIIIIIIETIIIESGMGSGQTENLYKVPDVKGGGKTKNYQISNIWECIPTLLPESGSS